MNAATRHEPLGITGVSEIRALRRGLRILETANLHNGAQLRDFVEITGLPKSTTHRILENLRAAGYLHRDDGDERYYLSLRVKRLSDGFYDGGWISEIARPILIKLSQTVGFPVAVATPYGTSMMLRDNTDARSNLAPNVYTPGMTLPLLTSASGKVFLAFCDDVTRKTLLEVCAQSDAPEHAIARHPQLLSRSLQQVRRQGYAFGPGAGRTRTSIETATIAVPIRSRQHLIGCLALRYLSANVRRKTVVERYLKTMNSHARLIGSKVTASAAV